MGVFESTVHFDNLTGVIDNQSSYQIKYRVTGPVNKFHDQETQYQQEKLLQEQQPADETSDYVYTGLVMPYSTKYFEFKDIQKEYKFSIFALKMNLLKNQEMIPLEKDLKIISENTVCIRITPQLKVIHLSNHEIQSLKLRKEIETKFLKSSSILKTQQFSHRLVGFFKNCPFKVKLLFRASQHNYDVKKFYEKYGFIESVLLICKTNANKVIGGYSRESFISPHQTNFDEHGWKNIHDKTNSSFIFSLSCNDIFTLKQGQNALFYNKNNQQICFGSDELRINNHSDKEICLTQNLNTNYKNHNYNNDLESYKLFNGNQSSQFTTKEWQVWRVVFEDEEEEEDSAMLALALDI